MGLCWSKKESAEARDCFAVLNAWLKSGDHKNSFLVLRMGCNGTNSPATVAVHADSWLASPKKARKSVQFAGVGEFDIAVVMDLSM